MPQTLDVPGRTGYRADPSSVDRLFVLPETAAVLEIVDLDPGEPPVQALVQIARADHAA